MRELKFRAWGVSNKKMYDRVLAGPGDPCSIVWHEEREEWLNFDNACGEIMQCTGLLDKNGREVYEGDVLRIVFPEYAAKEDDIGWVVWDDSEGAWHVQSFSWWCALSQPDQTEREIIGNIYEQPELVQ